MRREKRKERRGQERRAEKIREEEIIDYNGRGQHFKHIQKQEDTSIKQNKNKYKIREENIRSDNIRTTKERKRTMIGKSKKER